MNPNVKFYLMLFAAVLIAAGASASDLEQPWKTFLTIAASMGAAINGVLIQMPRETWSEEKRDALRQLKQLDKPASEVEPPDPPKAA